MVVVNMVIYSRCCYKKGKEYSKVRERMHTFSFIKLLQAKPPKFVRYSVGPS